MHLMMEYQFDSDYYVSSFVAMTRPAIFWQGQQLWPACLPAAAQQLHSMSSLQLQVSLIELFVRTCYSPLRSLCSVLCVLISKGTTGSTATGSNPLSTGTGDASKYLYAYTHSQPCTKWGMVCPPLKVPAVTLPPGHCPLWIHHMGLEVPIINSLSISCGMYVSMTWFPCAAILPSPTPSASSAAPPLVSFYRNRVLWTRYSDSNVSGMFSMHTQRKTCVSVFYVFHRLVAEGWLM